MLDVVHLVKRNVRRHSPSFFPPQSCAVYRHPADHQLCNAGVEAILGGKEEGLSTSWDSQAGSTVFTP
jgi:hypothetical protein